MATNESHAVQYFAKSSTNDYEHLGGFNVDVINIFNEVD
jgi:hypothetical protein